MLGQQAGGTVDVERVPGGLDQLGKAGASWAMKARSVGCSSRSCSRACSMREPTLIPTSCSLRYDAAQSASPESTGRSNVNTRFDTPPVDVMTTTISTCGWRGSTSTWRTVVVAIGGADTTASRLVTCESVSVVTRMASSTSRRTSESCSSVLVSRRAGSSRSTK